MLLTNFVFIRIISFFLVLAFLISRVRRIHVWPFMAVLQEIRSEVTRNVGILFRRLIGAIDSVGSKAAACRRR
jgi:hypothetical protein